MGEVRQQATDALVEFAVVSALQEKAEAGDESAHDQDTVPHDVSIMHLFTRASVTIGTRAIANAFDAVTLTALDIIIVQAPSTCEQEARSSCWTGHSAAKPSGGSGRGQR